MVYMVTTFTINQEVFHNPSVEKSFFKSVRDRINECQVPRCWILKDPADKGSIYLPRQFFYDRRGRRVQIRQALFQVTYREPAPIGRTIQMACGNTRCVNPAHMKVAGWEPSWAALNEVMGHWITEPEAKKWHGWKMKEEVEAEKILARSER